MSRGCLSTLYFLLLIKKNEAMNYKHKLFGVFTLAMTLFLGSCVDEDKDRFPEFLDGVNMRVIVDADNSFLNFQDLSNAKFAFDAYSSNKDLNKVEFLLTYVTIDSTYAEFPALTFSQSDFATGKLRKELTAADMAALVGKTAAQLQGGDLFNFRTQVTLNDGRVYPTLVLDDVTIGGTVRDFNNIDGGITNNPAFASFTSRFSTFVGCPSNIAGTYTTVTTGTSTDGCCPDPVTVNSTVTFTRTGPTTYRVTNFSAGMYDAWYCAPYDLCNGNTFNGLGSTMLDVCGNVTWTAGYWGSRGTGTIDGSGKITVTWENEFGDTGTTVFTK